jgi:predicted type IV restriction endonuclease
VDGIKKFQPIVADARTRDVAEADTVTIVTELLAEVFGYDKFKEITSEFPVKRTSCDIATKIDDKLQTLIEVKAIGHELKDTNVTQAVNYAANQWVDWVVLTNGQHWRAYSVECKGKVEQELVVDIDFLSLDHKSEDDLALLFLLCKEGWAKSAIDEYQTQMEALSRFCVGATILSDAVLAVIRRELHRVSPDVRIEIDDIKAVIEKEVIKREVLEGDKAEQARKKVAKAANVALRETT